MRKTGGRAVRVGDLFRSESVLTAEDIQKQMQKLAVPAYPNAATPDQAVALMLSNHIRAIYERNDALNEIVALRKKLMRLGAM